MEHVINLFVYGTLKRGHGNHRLLEGAEFIGRDEAPGRMYAGGVPVVKPVGRSPGEAGEWVKGEVYAVPLTMLPRIDRLEGHPDGYTRTTVTLRSGRSAEIYYWLHSVDHRDYEPSGEWVSDFARFDV